MFDFNGLSEKHYQPFGRKPAPSRVLIKETHRPFTVDKHLLHEAPDRCACPRPCRVCYLDWGTAFNARAVVYRLWPVGCYLVNGNPSC